MPLDDLPIELLLSIADQLDRQSDINAFARSSRRLYGQINQYLYQRNVRAGRMQALFWAAKCGREATAMKALDAGADVNLSVRRQGRHKPTALHVACAGGNLSFVTLLLSNGASINAKTIKGLTPLHIACYFRIAPVVELLLEHGASIKSRDIDHQTPLHYAVGVPIYESGTISTRPTKLQWAFHIYNRSDERKCVDIVATVEFLLACDADPTAVDKRGYSPESIAQTQPDMAAGGLICRAAASRRYEAGLVKPNMKEKERLTRRQALQAGKLAREQRILFEKEREEAEARKREELQGAEEQEEREPRARKAKRAIEQKLQNMRQWWRLRRETAVPHSRPEAQPTVTKASASDS